MEKKGLKRAIILNIAVLAAAVCMLATVSFAWFTLSKESNTGQNITVGSFSVDLKDEDAAGFTGTHRVNLTAAFPMTEQYAEDNSKGLDPVKTLENLYAFQVQNAGTVSAMIRFRVSVQDTAEPKIATQIRFKLRSYTDASAKGDWESRGLLTPPTGSSEPSLEGALNAIVTETVGTGVNASTAAAARGKLAGGEQRWFEVLVWLDENATVESVGASVAKSVTLRLTLQAMQSEGGASWENFAPAGR